MALAVNDYSSWLGPVLEHYEVQHSDRDSEQSVRCPLGTHTDRHPSASVNLGKGLWYCQTCAVGGDAIKLVEERENVRFAEAVEFAGRIVGADERTLRGSDDEGGGFLAHRPRDRQGGSRWRFTWGSSE